MTRMKIGLVVRKEATKPGSKVESAKLEGTKEVVAPAALGIIEDPESHKKFVRNLFALVAF